MSKINDYTRHHFVPEVYLKQFCLEIPKTGKRLYTFDKKCLTEDLPKKLNHYAPKSICFVDRLYTLKDINLRNILIIDDEQSIEKEAFKKYENLLGLFINKIRKCSPEKYKKIQIPEDQMRFFFKTLISIKKRNPSIISNEKYQKSRQAFHGKQREEIDEKLNNINLSLDERQNLEVYKSMLSGNESSDDMMKIEFLVEEWNPLWTNLVELMLNKPCYIYNTSENQPFITSDNPGLFIDVEKSLFYNILFEPKLRFVFPLSPMQCLVIHFDQPDSLMNNNKYILNHLATPSTVEYINGAILGMATRYVYSNSQSALLNLATNFKKLNYQ